MIKVGAPTDVALKERLRRTEGALAATQAAIAEGIVPGGGTALLRAEDALDDVQLEGDYARGVDVVRAVLAEPLYWIAVQRRLRRPGGGRPGPRDAGDGHGLDALTGEFGDLFEKGVIDPVRVTRLSLEHAASVAALLLTTEALVAEELIAQPGAIDRARLRRPRGGAGPAVLADLSRCNGVRMAGGRTAARRRPARRRAAAPAPSDDRAGVRPRPPAVRPGACPTPRDAVRRAAV